MLTFIPFPLPEESPDSIIKRFALNNGCLSRAQLRSLCSPIKLEDEYLTCNGKLPQWIANKSGNYSDRFISGFYKIISTDGREKIEIQGLSVPKRFVRWTGYAYCSECFSCGSESFMKDLKTSLACPIHNRAYLFSCPNCKTKLKKTIPIGKHCSCGAKLISPRCIGDDAASERFILNLFREKDQDKINSIIKCLQLLEFNYSNPTSQTQRNILAASISIVNEDQSGLELFLLRLRNWHPKLPPEALCAKLSKIRDPIKNQACSSFVSSTNENRSRDNINLYGTPPSAFTLSITQVKHQLKMKSKPWKALRESILPKHRQHSRRQHLSESEIVTIFSQREIAHQENSLPTNLAGGIQPTAAASILGISRHYLRYLISDGHLVPRNSSGSPLLINPDDLQKLIDKTEHFKSIQKKTQKSHLLVKRAMSALDIKPIGKVSKYSQALFSKSDGERVQNYLQNQERYRTPVQYGPRKSSAPLNSSNVTEFVTYSDAYRKFGLTGDSLRSLVKSGIIKPHPIAIKGRVAYSLDDLNKFKNEYITPSACARRLDIKANLLSKILRQCGVLPVIGPPTDDAKHRLFRLLDIENLITEESSEDTNILTINEASVILGAPQSLTHHLILSGIIAANTKTRLSKLFACPRKTERFWAEHVTTETASSYLGIGASRVKPFLAKLGINPISPALYAHGKTIYRASDFIDTEGQGTKRYHHVKEICSSWGIPQETFTKNFISTGYLHPLTSGKKVVVDESEYKKINNFLTSNHTASMIDRIIKSYSGFTYHLIRAGIINKSEYLPFELRNKIFIRTSDIFKARLALENRSRLPAR